MTAESIATMFGFGGVIVAAIAGFIIVVIKKSKEVTGAITADNNSHVNASRENDNMHQNLNISGLDKDYSDQLKRLDERIQKIEACNASINSNLENMTDLVHLILNKLITKGGSDA